MSSNARSCSICLEDINSNESEFLPCVHEFHKECIAEWINENPICPLCKIPIYINSPGQLDSYNRYKTRLDDLKTEESKMFHSISSGNYNQLHMHMNDLNIGPSHNLDNEPLVVDIQNQIPVEQHSNINIILRDNILNFMHIINQNTSNSTPNNTPTNIPEHSPDNLLNDNTSIVDILDDFNRGSVINVTPITIRYIIDHMFNINDN